MLKRFSGCISIALFVGVAFAPPAFAQAGRATISGTVYDQDKAVLPGVTVTVTEENTGLSRNTVTGGDGTYVIPTLLPGRYTIKADLTGFRPTSQTGVNLSVGQELTIDLSLQVGLQEAITVTGESPLVEVTASRIGSNVSNQEIDSLPSQGRSQLSLMSLIPGLTPSLSPGSFEGGQFNANGRETTSNLFLVDGVYNNDDRRGGSQANQARVTLDTMAEYQVLTHQYTAEYGGASGVVVNAVTRSGTNKLAGRAFYYYQDESLNATDHFLEEEGLENPEAGSKVFGGSLGGPIVQNKAFWFFNIERNLINQAANLIFPPEAAPLANSYSDSTDIRAWNTFIRTDYQLTANNNLSFRWVREAAITDCEDLQDDLSILENCTIENDSGDQVASFSWTSVLGNRSTNEFRVSHVRENLLQGGLFAFDCTAPECDSYNFVGLGGREQFDIGSMNEHEDFTAGPSATFQQDKIRTYGFENTFTYIRSGWRGDHTFKAGFGWSRNSADPQEIGGNLIGTFEFLHNLPFDAANPFTYPSVFSIRLGETLFEQRDWRVNFYLQDKWQVNNRLTLNLGLRYDKQDLVDTNNAFAPRLGVAYDIRGNGRSVLRGGIGKFYEYQPLTILATLLTQPVISPAVIYETDEDEGPLDGVLPEDPCLLAAGDGQGRALISAACRAQMADIRSQVFAGGFTNANPSVDGNRKLGYLWSFSIGFHQQLSQTVAVGVDYIGNRGRDQTGLIDLNEPTNGVRPQAPGFDPNGELVPAGSRDTRFQRFLQFQTLEAFDTDYNALELSLEKRFANRWGARMAYTLAKTMDVGTAGGVAAKRVSDDFDPRSDYGRANFDNRHAFVASANAEIWRGFGAGLTFKYYSGNPINEIIGRDVNRDNDNFDRPVAGVDDLTRPIVSELDANGRAVRNGIDGEDQLTADARLHYLWRFKGNEIGFFWEIYNLTNRDNFGNPTGNRNSSNFLVPVAANTPRTMQLGVRYTF
ncbi:MAG TPA: TonB-dependent receptor [Vicinamibacterales bacterium]|nr:TonB-dependent receptor [Vicinamibacterales bacterium]